MIHKEYYLLESLFCIALKAKWSKLVDELIEMFIAQLFHVIDHSLWSLQRRWSACLVHKLRQ